MSERLKLKKANLADHEHLDFFYTDQILPVETALKSETSHNHLSHESFVTAAAVYYLLTFWEYADVTLESQQKRTLMADKLSQSIATLVAILRSAAHDDLESSDYARIYKFILSMNTLIVPKIFDYMIFNDGQCLRREDIDFIFYYFYSKVDFELS